MKSNKYCKEQDGRNRKVAHVKLKNIALFFAMLLILSVSPVYAASKPCQVTVSVMGPGGAHLIGASVTFNSASEFTSNSGSATFGTFSNSTYTLQVSMQGYQTYRTVSFIPYNTTILTLNVFLVPSGLPVVSAFEPTFAQIGAYQGVNVTFTSYTAMNVDVFFVWKDASQQTVQISAEVNVGFSAGESLSFFSVMPQPGAYTVDAFVFTASDFAPVSTSYQTSVVILS